MPTLTRLLEHYDAKYQKDDYSQVSAVPLVKHPRDRYQMTVRLAAQDATGTFLEIGAGNGGVLLSLVNRYDRLVGTELSSVRARQLQLLFQGNPKVKILQNNVEVDGLPFGDDEFDTVAMVAVIEHTVDPITVLREIHRVLKPRGRLIVDTPNIAKWTRRLKLLAGYFPSTASFREGLLCYDKKTPTDLHDEGHLHYFTYRSLRDLALDRAGFSNARNFGYGGTPLGALWPSLFSEICMTLYK